MYWTAFQTSVSDSQDEVKYILIFLGRGRTAPTGWRNFGGREGNVDEVRDF